MPGSSEGTWLQWLAICEWRNVLCYDMNLWCFAWQCAPTNDHDHSFPTANWFYVISHVVTILKSPDTVSCIFQHLLQGSGRWQIPSTETAQGTTWSKLPRKSETKATLTWDGRLSQTKRLVFLKAAWVILLRFIKIDQDLPSHLHITKLLTNPPTSIFFE